MMDNADIAMSRWNDWRNMMYYEILWFYYYVLLDWGPLGGFEWVANKFLTWVRLKQIQMPETLKS